MSISLSPPTPDSLDYFSINEAFRDNVIKLNLNEIMTALYYLMSPHLTSMQKADNWNAINARIKVIQDRGIVLRREAQKPKVKTVDPIDMTLIDKFIESA